MKDSKKNKLDLKKELGINPMTILTCITAFLIILSIFIGIMYLRTGAKSMFNKFENQYSDYSEKAKNAVTNHIYDKVEEANHSSGSVYINLGEIKEVSNLQVYEVGHDAYVIENKGDNPVRETLWVCYTAVGTYKVDLSCAEYAVDNINKKVTVTVPELEFGWSFVYEDAKVVFEADELDVAILENKGKITEQIQSRLLAKATEEMSKFFDNNQENDNKAKQAAKDSIERMIKILNPNIQDITVEVNYY